MESDTRRPLLLAVFALLSTAVLNYFGTGLTPIAALTWLAPLPTLLVAPRLSGWSTAVVTFAGFTLGTANQWEFQLHSHDEPLVPIGLLIDLCMPLFSTLAVLLFRLLVRQGRALLAAVTAPAAWIGLTYLASVLNPTGIVGTFANDQGNVPIVLQTASVAGMWGVDFLVMFAPSAVAALCAPTVSRAARLRTGALALVVVSGALGFGAIRSVSHGEPEQRVAAITTTGNIWAAQVDTPAGKALLAGFIDQIRRLPGDVRTVVLPEGVFGSATSSPSNLPAAFVDPLTALARQRHLTIVAGVDVGAAKYNLALAFPADGGAPAVYLKEHDMVSPHGHQLVFVPGAPVPTGLAICADLDFPNPSRDYAIAGSRTLTVPAADNGVNGWQHSRTALLRGVENGQSLIFADENGQLMIADAVGQVLAARNSAGPGEFSVITAELPAGPGATFYSRTGDWIAWLCYAIVAAGLLAGISRGYASRRDRTGAVAPGDLDDRRQEDDRDHRSQRSAASR